MTVERVVKKLIPCNLCGGEHHTELYPDELGDAAAPTDYGFSQETRKTYRIVRCDDCGLIFTNPMPSLITSYEEEIDDVYLSTEAQRSITAQRALKKILTYKTSGRLLDVGCSTGIFLDQAAKHFTVEGLELSKWAVARAAQRHRVHRVTLDDFKPAELYDVVTLYGVIEHFEDPKSQLVHIGKLLKPGGLAVIYTGDADAWLPRLLKKKWWWYQGMHLYYFSHTTLRRMLADSGMAEVGYDLQTVDFELRSLATSLNRYSLGRLTSPILNLPGIRNIRVPLRLSGEMVLYAVKKPAAS